MTRSSQVALTILLACFTVAWCKAAEPVPAPANDQSPTQQVGPQHEDNGREGLEDYRRAFLVVYLEKKGDWGKDDCITVCPDPAEISLTENPRKVRWVVLNKQDGHEWEMIPKKENDDCVPPLHKKIPKGKGANAFKSGAPKDCREKPTDPHYDWNYDIKLTEVDEEGNPTGKKCKLDPKIKVSG
ncbi:MAG: hypothetical protein WBH85_11095 [Thermoanaerobaculia bacterium]